MIMAKIIKASGEFVAIEPKNGKNFSLEELQSIVGGYIEIVYLSDGSLMVVNEEGLLKELPYNLVASGIAGFYIVGDVLLCKENQMR